MTAPAISFGPSLDSSDVEKAMQAHLEAWMPTEIAEMRRRKDPESKRWPRGVQPIKTYRISHLATPQKWPEDQIPTIVIGSFGEVDNPRIEETTRVIAQFAVVVLCVATGKNEEDSIELSRLYASAARQAILQHPSLGGFANGVQAGPESNSPVTKGVEAARSLHGCARPYTVEVEDVLELMEGPADPLPDPEETPSGWPHVKDGGAHLEVRPGQAALDQLRENGHFS